MPLIILVRGSRKLLLALCISAKRLRLLSSLLVYCFSVVLFKVLNNITINFDDAGGEISA